MHWYISFVIRCNLSNFIVLINLKLKFIFKNGSMSFKIYLLFRRLLQRCWALAANLPGINVSKLSHFCTVKICIRRHTIISTRNMERNDWNSFRNLKAQSVIRNVFNCWTVVSIATIIKLQWKHISFVVNSEFYEILYLRIDKHCNSTRYLFHTCF